MTSKKNKQLEEFINTLGGAGDLNAPPGSRSWAIAVKLEMQSVLHNIAFNERQLKAWANLMQQKSGYRQLVNDRGNPFESYEEFCQAKPPFGLGCVPVEDLNKVAEELFKSLTIDQLKELYCFMGKALDLKDKFDLEETANMRSSGSNITKPQKDLAELELYNERREFDYDTKEYSVETLLKNASKLIVPKHQQKKDWDEKKQSTFIESMLLDLPLPAVILHETFDENDIEQLQIVDGIERIRTVISFVRDELTLTDLKKLTALNGFKFSDLLVSRQRRFNRTSVRIIEFSKKTSKENCRNFCARLNSR
jgi:hypothetical protein